MFSFFKTVFTSFYDRLRGGLSVLFSRTVIDQSALQELEKLLLEADVGITTTRVIIARVKEELGSGTHDGAALKKALEKVLLQILDLPKNAESKVYLLVGINGSGKTTAAAKLAYSLKEKGKKVLLVAGDTFRAAGASQLQSWADRLHIECVAGQPNQDPASVIYTGVQRFKEGGFDAVIIDTAGRLQTKSHLMKELEKVKRVISAQLPGNAITALLTIDAMLGQNSFEQAQIFHQSIALDGAILTKCDGTGKGGIIFALADQLKIPVVYVAHGESVEQWQPFQAPEFVARLLE